MALGHAESAQKHRRHRHSMGSLWVFAAQLQAIRLGPCSVCLLLQAAHSRFRSGTYTYKYGLPPETSAFVLMESPCVGNKIQLPWSFETSSTPDAPSSCLNNLLRPRNSAHGRRRLFLLASDLELAPKVAPKSTAITMSI